LLALRYSGRVRSSSIVGRFDVGVWWDGWVWRMLARVALLTTVILDALEL
jgi:hypothetical protein